MQVSYLPLSSFRRCCLREEQLPPTAEQGLAATPIYVWILHGQQHMLPQAYHPITHHLHIVPSIPRIYHRDHHRISVPFPIPKLQSDQLFAVFYLTVSCCRHQKSLSVTLPCKTLLIVFSKSGPYRHSRRQSLNNIYLESFFTYYSPLFIITYLKLYDNLFR